MSQFARRSLILFLTLAASLRCMAAQDEDIAALEEQSMTAAVARVAPSVVRIETVGGMDRIGEVLLGDGPTTGLIVDSDGFIISSAFNFLGKPSSILVTLPSGKRTLVRGIAALPRGECLVEHGARTVDLLREVRNRHQVYAHTYDRHAQTITAKAPRWNSRCGCAGTTPARRLSP